MAYEYLNETTFSRDLEQQDEMLNYLTSRAEEFQTDDNFLDFDSDLVEILAANSDDTPEMEDQEEGDISQPSDDGTVDVDIENFDDTDMQLLGFLFNEQSPDPSGAGSLRDAQGVVDLENIPTGLDWLKKKTSNVKFQNLNSNISKYLNTLPENLRSGLVATSGNDQDHVEDSKHFSDNAIDLRFNKQAYDFISKDPVLQRLGLKVLNPNHGTAPHIHLESNKPQTKKYGGNTLYAETEATQRIGLNNPNYNSAILDLVGQNKIRGLDNHQPVAVTDGNKYKVLYGPQDTATFKGKVYEKRL